MKRHILAICDPEERYVNRFVDYLQQTKKLPFEIRMYTDVVQLISFCKSHPVEIAIVSESIYTDEIEASVDGLLIILDEGGNRRDLEIYHVDKYQPTDNIVREVMCYYTEQSIAELPSLMVNQKTKLIGVYSPVKRCLQTSFSLTLGQILGKTKKVLYFNLESYSGFGKMLERDFQTDLTDLLYYMKHSKEKLFFRLESMVEHVNGLDIVPPIFSLMDLNQITMGEWKELIETVSSQCSYDYIILDLSDSIQGLFDILRMCEKVYTITREDGVAQAKVVQYEKLLKMAEYIDVLEKTKRYQFPTFQKIPYKVEQLPFSELGEYLKKIVGEEFYE